MNIAAASSIPTIAIWQCINVTEALRWYLSNHARGCVRPVATTRVAVSELVATALGRCVI
jgi:hypothetical protein